MSRNIKQCKCGKTISKFNGDLEKETCFVCLENQVNEATRKRTLSDYVKNVQKKDSKPRKKEPNLHKLADIVGN